MLHNQSSPRRETFLDEQLLKVFEARIHGDKTVNEYRLYDAIELELRRKNKLFSDRPLRWNAISISRWYDDFEYGCSLSKLSDYDTIEIVNILLNTDLFVFVGNDNGKFKQQLFDNHKHLLDKIPTMTPEELTATNLLLANASPYLPEAQRTAYTQALTAATLAHPSTNRPHRTALHRPAEIPTF